MANRFEVSTIFKGIDRMSAPLTRMQRKVNDFTRNAQTKFKKLNSITGGFGKSLALGGIAAVGGFTASVTKATMAGVDFEQTLVNAAAKFPGDIKKGSAEFNVLKKAAMDAGATTEFTATDAAQALNYLAMAGFDANASVAALPGVINVATAAQTDLASATDIVTDALGAFNLNSKDPAVLAKNLQKVSDVMVKTTVTANTNMEQLFETLRKGAPLATQAGASIAEVNAAAGLMANSGIKGELAGTAIANMFLNVSAPVGQGAKVIKALGLQFKTAKGTLKPLSQMISEFNKKTAKLTETQKTAAMQAVFGREGLAGIMALLKAGGPAFQKYVDQLNDSSGATNKMANTMRDTTRGSLNNLTSAIESVSIKLFDMTGGPIKEVIDRMTDWVRVNGEFIAQDIGKFVLGVAENMGTILKTLKWVGGTAAGLWAVGTALQFINLVLATNPLVLLATAAIGAVAAIIYFSDEIKGWDRAVKNSMVSAWNNVKKFMRKIADEINNSAPVAVFNMAAGWVQQLTGLVDSLLSPIVSYIDKVISGIIDKVTNFFTTTPETNAAVNAINASQPAYLGFNTPGYGGGYQSQIIPPAAPRTIESTSTSTNKTEVTIKSADKDAVVTQTGPSVPGVKVKSTGGF